MNYNKKKDTKVRALKFSSPNACTLGINELGSRNAQYSTDGESWSDWDGTAVPFGNGTDIYVRGNNPTGWNNSISNYASFTMTGSNVSCEGNIMHMLSYEEDLTTIPCGDCFSYLFDDCSSLVNAPELPATTLTDYCYSEMFYNCSSLVTAPELPATTLASRCYYKMFNGCSSLVNAPELPATTLADGCYDSMFNGCTSLVNAPELPATTLADGCYGFMFEGCEELNHIKMLATNIQAGGCLISWTNGISSTGTFECAQGMSTVIPRGTDGIPIGWTVTEVA